MKRSRPMSGHFGVFLSLLLLISSLTVRAQRANITGRVTSGADRVPGVSVRLKNTNQGTLTDQNGQFSLQAAVGDTLVFNHISYAALEMPVKSLSPMEISLVSNTQNVNEVVVVGYGTQKRATLTGSIS